MQGNWAVGQAIAYWTKLGCAVSIPLTDSQDYDLLIDICGKIAKVQVKSCTYKRAGKYVFNLSVKGGNRSYNTIKKFDKQKVDMVFVATPEGSYLIPSFECPKNIGTCFEKYKIAVTEPMVASLPVKQTP